MISTEYPHVYQLTDNLFYWVDETGELSEGYETAEDAKAVLDKYCEYLNQQG